MSDRETLRQEIINSPETADFMAAVPLEAAHQRERFPVRHDAGKTPFDWFWLIGYLSQKAAVSAVAGDIEKAKHHTISTGAALANWHAALSGTSNEMRPGIEPPDMASALTAVLARLSKRANDAWSPDGNIRISLAPNGLVIDGMRIDRTAKKERRATRIAMYPTLARDVDGHWLDQLFDQVVAELERPV